MVVAEAAVLEPVVGPALVTVVVTVVAMLAVMVMVSPLAIAMTRGPASRLATAVGQRSLHPAASIARVRQPDDCPPRHLDGRIHQVG